MPSFSYFFVYFVSVLLHVLANVCDETNPLIWCKSCWSRILKVADDWPSGMPSEWGGRTMTTINRYWTVVGTSMEPSVAGPGWPVCVCVVCGWVHRGVFYYDVPLQMLNFFLILRRSSSPVGYPPPPLSIAHSPVDCVTVSQPTAFTIEPVKVSG